MMATAGGSSEERAAGGRAATVRGTRSRRTVWFPRRDEYSSETKPFFLTSEFLVFVLYLMGLGIAAGTSPTIDDRMFWILTTAATIGYMVARGVAKSGSRS